MERGGGIIYIYIKKSKLKDKRRISLGHSPVGSVPNTLLFFLCPDSAAPSFRESEGKQHQQRLTQVTGWIQDRPTRTDINWTGLHQHNRYLRAFQNGRARLDLFILNFFVLALFWKNRSYTIGLRHCRGSALLESGAWKINNVKKQTHECDWCSESACRPITN